MIKIRMDGCDVEGKIITGQHDDGKYYGVLLPLVAPKGSSKCITKPGIKPSVWCFLKTDRAIKQVKNR